MSVRDKDLHAMMRLLSDGDQAGLDPDQPLPWSVLTGVMSLIPCDAIEVVLLDSKARTCPEIQDLPADPAITGPVTAAAVNEVFFHHYWDCLDCPYPDLSGDLDSVLLTSDFYTLPQLRSTGMWSDYLHVAGLERELIVCLAGVPGRTLRVRLGRHGRDFSDRDRALMWLLRPHLYGLYRQRRLARSGRALLTARQRSLLDLVAAGRTNGQISRRLGISESTVRRHLEHIYQRLQVSSRAAAVARAFPGGDL
jgi:DNA-binding CsgD family transcriptional regulator